jgi:nucleotide-binding universal stress UspA family protein
VAWNGTRESARALAESLPYLHQASKVGVLVVEGEHQTETDALKASDAVLHLRHRGIGAVKYRAFGEEDETADVLIAECHALGANLLVMGSYGHSRLHDLLPGSTTSRILQRSPIPLLIPHQHTDAPAAHSFVIQRSIDGRQGEGIRRIIGLLDRTVEIDG